MGEALVFGLLGSSALVLGAALGSYWDAPRRVTGVMLAFASGTLLSALAFELFPEAVELGGLTPAGAGLLIGGFVVVVINAYVDSRVASDAGDPDAVPGPDAVSDELSGATGEQREKVHEAAQADTLMPEAFEHGRPLNSFATAIGFFVSFVLAGG